VFCGNFEYDAPEKEILGLFEKYGRVHRIDMKTGEPAAAAAAACWALRCKLRRVPAWASGD
jgi:hypothetical protein